MSEQTRESIVKQFVFTDDTQKSDLLDESKTNTNLIALLVALVDRGWGGGRVIVESVKTDHSDDSALGPHSHEAGYAIDVALESNDPAEEKAFLEDCVAHDSYCDKVGLGGRYQAYNDDLAPIANATGTVVFNDNSTDHIHLQTA